MKMPTRECTRCHLQIAWVVTNHGRRMPLDPTPNPEGNVYVAALNGKLIATVRTKDDPRPRGIAYMPHFATCTAIAGKGKQRLEPKPTAPPKPEPPEPLTLDLG